MDRLYRIITDVTLTTPLPPPYKVLYRFENMTEELKVKTVSARWHEIHSAYSNCTRGTLSLTFISELVFTFFKECKIFYFSPPQIQVIIWGCWVFALSTTWCKKIFHILVPKIELYFYWTVLFSCSFWYNYNIFSFIRLSLFNSSFLPFFCPCSCPHLLILFFPALHHRATQFKSLALGQNVSDISLCNSFVSLFLSYSTCCRLRKLRRDYCNWPIPTWDHSSLRWTSYTAGYRHFCFSFG